MAGRLPRTRGCSVPPRTRRARNTMCSRCSPTPRAASIWAMSATTPWATCWPATCARGASTCSIRWGGTPSACRPRTPPLSVASIPAAGPTTTSPPCAGSSNPWACRSTGRARSPPAIPIITDTSRRCLSTSWPPGWSSASSAGQLGPGRPDGARQRAGHRGPRLALRRAGREARARPVVSQDHRLFARASRCPRRPDRLARKGPADAAQLDRPLGRRCA